MRGKPDTIKNVSTNPLSVHDFIRDSACNREARAGMATDSDQVIVLPKELISALKNEANRRYQEDRVLVTESELCAEAVRKLLGL